jgi:hypothetical protein
MQVLITGAAGTRTGDGLLPTGTFDIQPLNTAYRTVRGDVGTQAQVHKATADVDLIVLTIAIHGIYPPNPGLLSNGAHTSTARFHTPLQLWRVVGRAASR